MSAEGGLVKRGDVPSSSQSRSFVELDDRVASGQGGIAIVLSPSQETADAIAAHVARRARAAGIIAMEPRARSGTPLWREVASRLGIRRQGSDPFEAASTIARAATLRRIHVVATLPRAGSWDRDVACRLASLADCPPVVFVAPDFEVCDDLRADTYEVGATLDAAGRRRWWAALGESAQTEVAPEAISSLEAWWRNARGASAAPQPSAATTAPESERVLAALSLAARAWPAAELAALGADQARIDILVRAGAVVASEGWLVVDPKWEVRAEALASRACNSAVERVTEALMEHFALDAWAQARAAELLLRVGATADADDALARALAQAENALARREIDTRWRIAVAAAPLDAQRPLLVAATERALALGEADEAFRWAQSAAARFQDDPRVTLLFGQAAVAFGDLVAAKLALEVGARRAENDPSSTAAIAAELAEVAYLSGDLPAAEREASRALSTEATPVTKLKARNTLGKLLLANSSWDEADAHFAEDAWAAAAAGLRTEELRARLNRGIALLSKGLVDEARAIFDWVLGEGERAADGRAIAFALDNLSVVAALRHDYAQALAFAERTLKLRQKIGDRLALARVLSNVADLRRCLGLQDHAEHAVAFGRRMLGPGMPAARSALFSLQAARNALARNSTALARREARRALAESEAAGTREDICAACRISARVALDDGELACASAFLAREREATLGGEIHPETAIVAARYARACGDESDETALEALAAARSSGKEDSIIEAHALLAEIYRAAGHVPAALSHVEQALALRDQVAATLPGEIRSAFLARRDLVTLAEVHAILVEPAFAKCRPRPGGDDGMSAEGGVVKRGDVPSRESPPGPASKRRSPPPPSTVSREIIGDDPAIRGLLSAVKKVACSDSLILVRGESGTGKELVAEAIHRASDRADGPLVTVNCAALVETLLLSELFGHERGAFTGAVARRRGRFEMAEGGTLFLDEIGDISARTQVALLRVLQERTFERVGGAVAIRANVRIICATHRDLRAMVERGEFREDLYYRLRGITLEVPPLRARLGDVPRISQNLLSRIATERGEATKTLTVDALELLGRHRWPGNVRELENALRAASLFAEGDRIGAADFIDNVDDLRAAVFPARSRSSDAPFAASAESAPMAATSAVESPGIGGPLHACEESATAVAYAHVRGGSTSLPDMKRQIERDCIARALAETSGNITRAAALLGMKRPRLSQLVKQYGLATVLSEDAS